MASINEIVIARSGGYCEYCKAPAKIILGLEIEHIVPISAGGQTTADNLCYACRFCNGRKWAHQTGIDPETNTETLLFNPRLQVWYEHFEWREDFTQLEGKTPIGRATIQRLKLNSPTMIEARKEWRKAGWQPSEKPEET